MSDALLIVPTYRVSSYKEMLGNYAEKAIRGLHSSRRRGSLPNTCALSAVDRHYRITPTRLQAAVTATIRCSIKKVDTQEAVLPHHQASQVHPLTMKPATTTRRYLLWISTGPVA